jgi:hypothetical protein
VRDQERNYRAIQLLLTEYCDKCTWDVAKKRKPGDVDILRSFKPYLRTESVAGFGCGNMTTGTVTCWRQTVSRLGRAPFMVTISILLQLAIFFLEGGGGESE